MRVIDVMMVEDERLYTVAARGKGVLRRHHAHALRGHRGAVAGFPHLPAARGGGASRRQAGIDRIFELNPSMRELYPAIPYVLEPFYLRRAQGEYFDLSGKPIVRVPFALGSLRSRRRVRHHGPLPGMRRLRRRVSRSLHRGGRRMPSSRSIACAAGCAGRRNLRCDRPPFVTELDEPTRSSWLRRNARFGRNMPPMPIWPSNSCRRNRRVFRHLGLWRRSRNPPGGSALGICHGVRFAHKRRSGARGNGARLRPATGSG